jgi:hypothetical protein
LPIRWIIEPASSWPENSQPRWFADKLYYSPNFNSMDRRAFFVAYTLSH